MKIVVNFLNGNVYWRSKVNISAQQASDALSDPTFLANVRAVPFFDYTADSPATIGDRLAQAGDVAINVSFYSKWWTRAIAFEDKNGVHFNTRKESYGAGGPGDLAHELMHQLGYLHNGNAAAGNLDTVPYKIGSMVDAWVKSRA